MLGMSSDVTKTNGSFFKLFTIYPPVYADFLVSHGDFSNQKWDQKWVQQWISASRFLPQVTDPWPSRAPQASTACTASQRNMNWLWRPCAPRCWYSAIEGCPGCGARFAVRMCPAFVSKCGFEAMELISEYIWFEARCLLIINKCRPVIFCILNWFQTFLSSTIRFFSEKIPRVTFTTTTFVVVTILVSCHHIYFSWSTWMIWATPIA